MLQLRFLSWECFDVGNGANDAFRAFVENKYYKWDIEEGEGKPGSTNQVMIAKPEG